MLCLRVNATVVYILLLRSRIMYNNMLFMRTLGTRKAVLGLPNDERAPVLSRIGYVQVYMQNISCRTRTREVICAWQYTVDFFACKNC